MTESHPDVLERLQERWRESWLASQRLRVSIKTYQLSAATTDGLTRQWQSSAYVGRALLDEWMTFLESRRTRPLTVRSLRLEGDAVILHFIEGIAQADEVRLTRIARRLYWARRLVSPASPVPGLTYWIVPLSGQRTFPTLPTDAVRPDHINGGFTYRGGRDVFVYRFEEFSKVLMHETMHQTRLHVEGWDTATLDRLKRTFRIHPAHALVPNDAWIEAWALLLHTMALSYEWNVPLGRLLDIEKRWSLKQAVRILSMQQTRPDGLWAEESTHSYAYLVFKNALLQNVAEWAAVGANARAPRIARWILAGHRKVSRDLATKARRVSWAGPASMRMTVFGDA